MDTEIKAKKIKDHDTFIQASDEQMSKRISHGPNIEKSETETLVDKISSRLLRYPYEEFQVHNKEVILIGSGSYGKVYKYHHKKLKEVAVKTFSITGSSKLINKRQDTIYLEANVLSQFCHPNIVKIMGITQNLDMVGIIMEFVDGGNLQELLWEDIKSDASDIPWSTRLQIAKQTVSALSYIHNYDKKKTFCHGDLKTENVLITKGLQVKLADFGSSSLIVATGASVTTSEVPSTTQHTIAYVAPEYLKDLTLDRTPAMDMYSFGSVLYEIITRQIPYSDCKNPGMLPALIPSGAKPNEKPVNEAESQLKSKEDDFSIFKLLKSAMQRCWNDDQSLRPSSKSVEMELNELLELTHDAHTQAHADKTFSDENVTFAKLSLTEKVMGVTLPLVLPDTVKEEKEAGGRDSFALRKYQLELVGPAARGMNCVIVAPTGSGKTYVALQICRDHLTTEDKKVVFLVPTVPLVQQHYNCFRRHLEETVHVSQVSGGNDTYADVAEILDANQVLIMTHQVLLNVLKNNNFDISDISLLMFDECHHTMKEHPYKQIMDHYMKKKAAGASSGSGLPQIVGLTASPGSGKAKIPEKALEYIKQFLGNLDVTIAPVQVVKNLSELSEYAKLNEFDTIPITRPENDRFSKVLKLIMEKIEKVIRAQLADKASASSDDQDLKLELSPKRGSQKYEQDIVAFQDQSALLADKTLSKTLQIYAKHLREYNDALLVNEHVRPSDARDYIKKTLYNEAPVNEIERKLKEMYEKSGVARLASDQPSPLLEKLLQLLVDHFSAKPESRCIVFARTREIAMSLVNCCLEDPKRQVTRLQPEYLTGSGPRSIRGGMTKVEQEDLLQRFKEGTCKLLIATTVAEEGLDIKACNFVVTYNHTTNEVAQVQRKGRGRAKGSKMYVLAYSDRNFIEKEKANAARNKLTLTCLQDLREMDPDILAKEIEYLQLDQLRALSLEVPIKRQTSDRLWELQCKKCRQKATTSDQVRLIKGMHHIVVDPTFPAKREFISTTPKSFSPDEVKIGMVRCGDPTCNNDWGMQMTYKNVPFSVLKAGSFVVVDDHGVPATMKQWKKAPFHIDNLSNSELAKLANDQL